MPKRTDIRKIMIIGSVAIIACLFVAPFVCRSQGPTEGACDDVSNVDFKNGVVDLGAFGSLKFEAGQACRFESRLPGQDPACDCASGKCDWDMRIQEDREMSPEPRTHLRLLIVSESHLTGSGAWGQVLIFGCQRGDLTKVMDRRYLYGVKFTEIKNGFELESGYWLPADARCCPSKRQREWFRWDSTKHKYVRSRRVVLNPNA